MQSLPYCLTQEMFHPEDDVDTLFQRLNQLEPPDDLVARILTDIGRLPRLFAYPALLPDPTREGKHES
ncbi:MAG: hypothetical protein ABI234_11730 [Ktedonobacteraceae bacterium]